MDGRCRRNCSGDGNEPGDRRAEDARKEGGRVPTDGVKDSLQSALQKHLLKCSLV